MAWDKNQPTPDPSPFSFPMSRRCSDGTFRDRSAWAQDWAEGVSGFEDLCTHPRERSCGLPCLASDPCSGCCGCDVVPF